MHESKVKKLLLIQLPLTMVLVICSNTLYAQCVAEYLMEEGGANVVGDTSGNANNAYFVNSLKWQNGHGASSQHCLYLDGANYFESPDSISLDSLTSGFTMTAWIKIDQNTSSDTIVWKLGSFRIWKNNTNLMISLTGVSTIQNLVLTNIQNGIWQHIGITYNGQWLKCYINGASVYSNRRNSSNVPISTSNNPLRVGWNSGGAPYYVGTLDNVRLYNNALSNTEIIADMSSDIAATQPLTMVQSGAAVTAIVIPTATSKQVEIVAANELQYHIKQATGATLQIYQENNKPTAYNGLIYIGSCNATAMAGIDCSYLEDNSYVIRNVGNNFFLAGNDTTGDPLGQLYGNNTHIGTMLSVYRFLEQYMGVKWLWPGPKGEVIPASSNLVANEISIIGKPVLKHARLNDTWFSWHSYLINDHGGWTSSTVQKNYLDAQSLWLRRQGFCTSINLEYSHAFEAWWDTYHLTHPEYFNMLPDGTRRSDPYYQNGNGMFISMCLSDPNFHKQIVDNWIAIGRPEYINCCENDTPAKCTCPRCMAWDEPDPDLTIPWAERLTYATNAFNAGQADWYKYLGSISTRYAKFLLAVQKEAENRGYDDAKVFGFAYTNYFKKPRGSIQLNKRIAIGVVSDPVVYFPWSAATQQEFRDSWSGWYDSNAQVFLRPNYLYAGYDFPINYSRRLGSDFLYALRRGMFATIYDTLLGQWSTQATNLYMLARVNTHVNADWESWGADINGDSKIDMSDLAALSKQWLDDVSDCGNRCGDLNSDGDVNLIDFVLFAKQWHNNNAEVESILDEFYNAFGPAKSAIKEYFNYWESVSDAASSATIADSRIPYEIFTPSVIAQGRVLMTNAQTAATGDATATRLVSFLEEGFTNAEKTLAAMKARDDYDRFGGAAYLAALQTARAELLTYRASVEGDFICNMSWLYYLVDQYW